LLNGANGVKSASLIFKMYMNNICVALLV
jgi:hypothetical protein